MSFEPVDTFPPKEWRKKNLSLRSWMLNRSVDCTTEESSGVLRSLGPPMVDPTLERRHSDGCFNQETMSRFDERKSLPCVLDGDDDFGFPGDVCRLELPASGKVTKNTRSKGIKRWLSEAFRNKEQTNQATGRNRNENRSSSVKDTRSHSLQNLDTRGNPKQSGSLRHLDSRSSNLLSPVVDARFKSNSLQHIDTQHKEPTGIRRWLSEVFRSEKQSKLEVPEIKIDSPTDTSQNINMFGFTELNPRQNMSIKNLDVAKNQKEFSSVENIDNRTGNPIVRSSSEQNLDKSASPPINAPRRFSLPGHEQPYSIKMSYAREALRNSDDMVLPMDLDENEAGNQVQFILRPTKKAPHKNSIEESGGKRKKFKKSPLINLFRKSRSSQESSMESASPPMLTPTGKLFGRSLTELCEDDVIPKPIIDMLYQLFLCAPFTTGIFRKGANQRQCRELQETLESGQTVNMEDLPILVIGATLKIFLRSLPDCMFMCEFYDEWCDAVENTEEKAAEKIKKIMEKLPKCHVNLIRYMMCVLYHISRRSDDNQMTSINLGICTGQSLLWPSTLDDMAAQADAAKRVPLFVQFMIDHCQQVLGEDTVHLFGEPAQQKCRPDSSTDSDSMHSMLSLQDQHGVSSRRMDSSLDSLDHSEMETSALLKTHLFQTNLSRDSGLTSSDTQLYSEHVEPCALPPNADLQQVRKKSLTRSTSQMDEIKVKPENPGVLSGSYDSSLNLARGEAGELVQPVPPPRKTRRKAPDPPANVVAFQSRGQTSPQQPQPLHGKSSEVQYGIKSEDSNEHSNNTYSSNTTPTSTGNVSVERRLSITKQRSSESIGSSLDGGYSASVESGDYPDGLVILNPGSLHKTDKLLKCNDDIGEIRKSSSGAKLYIDEQLLSDALPKQKDTKAATTQKRSSKASHTSLGCYVNTDIKKRTPPPMREPPSYEESVLRKRGKAAEIRAKSANRHSWNANSGESAQKQASPHEPVSGSSTSNSRSKSAVRSRSRNPTEVQLNNQVQPGAIHSRSVDNLQTIHTTTTPVGDGPRDVSASMQNLQKSGPSWGDGTPHQMMYTPPEENQGSPENTVLKSLLPEGDGKEEVMRKVRVGMTPKGGDIFPKHMRNIIRHSLHEDEFLGPQSGSRSRGRRVMRKSGSVDDDGTPVRRSNEPQRSESFAMRRPHPAEQMTQSRAIEKSASDTSVVEQFENNAKRHLWTRPDKPPSYQEAIQRKSLLKSGLPLLQVTDVDVYQQREKSSKAAQLYQESMKRFQRQVDDPTNHHANEGHVVENAVDSVDSQVTYGTSNRNNHNAAPTYRREPPPSRPITDKPTKQIRAAQHQQQVPGRIEKHIRKDMMDVTSGGERRKDVIASEVREGHDYHTTQSPPRDRSHSNSSSNTSRDRRENSSDNSQREGSNSYNGQRRNSDHKSRSSRNNRREHSGSNASNSSENESSRRQQQQQQTTTPTAHRSGNKKEKHNRSKSKSREQRSSDTRLENNKSIEIQRANRTNLVRSKSDSSEHISKLGRFKELQALDSNIIEQYRKSKLNAENEAVKDSYFFGKPRRRSVNSVRHRDWHKDLAEQYSDMFYMPPPEDNNNKIIYAYARRQSYDDNQSEEKPKKRWQPPVHPSKDLVVVTSNNNNQSQERQNSVKKDKRKSIPVSSSKWTEENNNSKKEPAENSGKENKPVVEVHDWRDGDNSSEAITKNVRERIAEFSKGGNVNAQSERQYVDDNKQKHHTQTQQQQQQIYTHTPARGHHQQQVHTQPQQPAHSYPASQHPRANAQHHHHHQTQQQQQQMNRLHAQKSQPVQQQSDAQQQQKQQQQQQQQQVSQSQGQQRRQTLPPHEQCAEDPEAGLTWSVAKLRNLYSKGGSGGSGSNGGNVFYEPTSSQTRSGKNSVKEATNADANEEYI